MKKAILSNELIPKVAQALGLDELHIRSINLYLEQNRPVELTVEMLGTEDLNSVTWSSIETKPVYETKSRNGDLQY